MDSVHLETIPEERELPRIRAFIPKSPETIKREAELEKLMEKYSCDKQFRIYYGMLMANTRLKKLCLNSRYFEESQNESKRPSQKSKCSVGTTIPSEDVQRFYRDKKNSEENNNNDMSAKKEKDNSAKCRKVKQCSVSTSISVEDIRMFYKKNGGCERADESSKGRRDSGMQTDICRSNVKDNDVAGAESSLTKECATMTVSVTTVVEDDMQLFQRIKRKYCSEV